MVNFKIYDVTDWTASNHNTHIAQYLTKLRESDNEIWSEKSYTKCGGEASPRPFYQKSKLSMSLDQGEYLML